MFRKTFTLAFVLAVVASPHISATAEPVKFSRDVLPILADRCFNCHGPDEGKREAELRLDQRESALLDRDGHAAIVSGDVSASELIARITSDDPDVVMPPPDSNRKSLDADEIDILRRWIAEGAMWGKHWSFEVPTRPTPPDSAGHPIDAFVRKRLAEKGLKPSPLASKETLIRRVTLDLTGLPPTTQQVRAFVLDDSPKAYERLVDRLLDSPHYGERMAWPWLDAARYADTGGYQGDPDRSMWPWRDWVIDALNDNMSFDQFTIEQLAGDLLADATLEQRLATGFNRNHMHNSEGGRIADETRVENVFDRVETTGTVWLGLTLQCARCHDHKFDPTSNQDYFSFFDFFNQTSEDGRTDRSIAIPPAIGYVSAKAKLHIENLDASVADLKKRLEDSALEPQLKKELNAELAELGERRASLEPKTKEVKVMVMDTRDKPRHTMILVKGIYNDVTDRKATAAVPNMLPPLPSIEGQPNTRLELARWIVSPENPLTARVTVNRYWQTFFGRGIVTTPDDFGLQGAQPSHPDLLDWLAVEFVESGWDVKHIHRLIVTSDTYRQSARVTPELLQIDPVNQLLTRAPRYRMPSWMLRDQALATSGLLAPTLGGPPVRPYQPDGIWAEATFGKKTYQVDSGKKLYRRSIYTFWRRIIGPTMFFDAARRQTCQVKRNLTNTPLHALTTLNDVTYVEAARVLARRAQQGHTTTKDRISWAFQVLTSRPPNDAELSLLEKRLAAYTKTFSDEPERATQLLSVGETPRDASFLPAEHAAYTALFNTLMNLDEALVKP